jgi:DNA polymerase
MRGLCDAVCGFDSHPLRAFAKRAVPPAGAGAARLMVVADFPSADDEESGIILSGAPGALFDKMLGSIGLSRENAVISPLLFWRAPGGRGPTEEELSIARPFVMRAAEIARPAAILTLGAAAAMEIAGAKLPNRHGEVIETEFAGAPVRVVPIWHPNYLMLKPDAKRDVWSALQKLQNLLQTL